MSESVNETGIVAKIMEQADKLYWYGYFMSRTSGSSYDYFLRQSELQGKSCCIITFKTILPKSLLKIIIRLFFLGGWNANYNDFNEENNHVVELLVEDELNRFGKKRLCSLVYKKEDTDKTIFNLFKKVREQANFYDRPSLFRVKKEKIFEDLKRLLESESN